MLYSQVKYSNVRNQSDFRLDADYYKPEYLKEDTLLKKLVSIEIGDFAFVTDGQHGYHVFKQAGVK